MRGRMKKYRRGFLVKSDRNAGDILSMGIMLLAMAYLMIVFMDCIAILRTREDLSQTVRRYTLIAETKGYLDASDRQGLIDSLKDLGISEIDLTGTTTERAGFGNTVTVRVRGRIDGKYEVNEVRASTAKY